MDASEQQPGSDETNEYSTSSTIVIIVAPLAGLVVSCFFCACCLFYFGRSGLALYLPRWLRACCIYEESESGDNDETDKLNADFDVEAARSKLEERGAYVVEVHLVRAQNLPRLDCVLNDRSFIGQSDPFVRLKLVSERSGENALEQGKSGESPKSGGWRTSRTCPNTLHPDFSESFRFHLLSSAPHDMLAVEFEVWDWDRFKPNDFSGRARLPIAEMLSEEKKEIYHWCNLAWRDGEPVMGGSRGDQRSQLQVRIRTSKCKDADTVIAEKKAQLRAMLARREKKAAAEAAAVAAAEDKDGTWDADDTKAESGEVSDQRHMLEGLDLRNTRRGPLELIEMDPSGGAFADAALREAVEADDKEQILRVLREKGAVLHKTDIRAARQHLRLLSARAVWEKIAEDDELYGRMQPNSGGGGGGGGASGGRGRSGKGNEVEDDEMNDEDLEELKLELAKQFADGSLSKAAYVQQKIAIDARLAAASSAAPQHAAPEGPLSSWLKEAYAGKHSSKLQAQDDEALIGAITSSRRTLKVKVGAEQQVGGNGVFGGMMGVESQGLSMAETGGGGGEGGIMSRMGGQGRGPGQGGGGGPGQGGVMSTIALAQTEGGGGPSGGKGVLSNGRDEVSVATRMRHGLRQDQGGSMDAMRGQKELGGGGGGGGGGHPHPADAATGLGGVAGGSTGVGHVSGAERQRNMQPPKTRREAGGDKRVAAPVFGGKGWSKHDPNPAAYPMHTRTPAIPDVSVGGSMRGSGGAVVEKDEGRNTGGNTEWNKLNLASMHTDDADLGANANMQHRARGMKITQHNQRAKKNVSISLQTSPAVATETSLASVAGNARLGSSLVSMESGGGRRGGVTPILRTMSTGSTQKGTASHKGGAVGAGGGGGGREFLSTLFKRRGDDGAETGGTRKGEKSVKFSNQLTQEEKV